MASKFSIKESYAFAFNTIKNNFKLFIIYFLFLILTILLASIEILIPFPYNDILIILSIILFITLIYLDYGFLNIGIKFSKFNRVSFKDFFISPFKFFKLIISSLIYAAIFLIGLILFIIPGIYFFFAFIFVAYLIIDKDMPIISSFKESYKITKGAKLDLFRLGLIPSLIIILIEFISSLLTYDTLNIFLIFFLIFFEFITQMIYLIALCFAYRKLSV